MKRGAVCNAGAWDAVADQPHTSADLRKKAGPRNRIVTRRRAQASVLIVPGKLTRFFRLTRVTRIFQKSVFTETTPRRPGGRPRRVFCCADASRGRARRMFSLQKRRQTMQFQKGESGNPAGRPRGARNRTTMLLQKLLEADGEALARKAIDLAKGGDLVALRMCMDRLMLRESTSRSLSNCRGSTPR